MKIRGSITVSGGSPKELEVRLRLPTGITVRVRTIELADLCVKSRALLLRIGFALQCRQGAPFNASVLSEMRKNCHCLFVLENRGRRASVKRRPENQGYAHRARW